MFYVLVFGVSFTIGCRQFIQYVLVLVFYMVLCFKLIGFMWLLVGLFVVEVDWPMIYHSDWSRLWFTAINIEDT